MLLIRCRREIPLNAVVGLTSAMYIAACGHHRLKSTEMLQMRSVNESSCEHFRLDIDALGGAIKLRFFFLGVLFFLVICIHMHAPFLHYAIHYLGLVSLPLLALSS